jgi:polyisoprenoid-binding protein YceI
MHCGLRAVSLTAILAASCLLLQSPVGAQAPGGRGRPAPSPASHDPSAAAAGTYTMDPDHTSIISRVLHEGTSYTTFRFYSQSGSLVWDPVHIENSKIDVTVEIKSLATPVAGFSERLMGERYLNLAKFTQARFVSTAVRPTSPTHYEVTGDLTFMGVTKPITVKADLVGIASSRAVPVIGFEGSARFNRMDFGLTALPGIVGDEIQLILDICFDRRDAVVPSGSAQ